MERIELKQLAKDSINKDLKRIMWVSFLMYLVYMLASLVLAYTYVGTYFVTAIMSLGTITFFINVVTNKEYQFNDLFSGFKENYLKKVWIYFVYTIYTVLWALLGYVTLGIGFIWAIPKVMGYTMVPYILANEDVTEMTATDVLARSTSMLDGHKMEFFVLSLSFILWILLGLVTAGIAMIYVNPYMSSTFVHYYLQLKDKDQLEVYPRTETEIYE